jgi:putative restriction endonuclease
MDLFREHAVREALIAHIEEVVARTPNGLVSYSDVESFEYLGERFVIRQSRGRGIHKPANLDAALSITTTYTPAGREPPYKDFAGADGFPRYKYEGYDPNHFSNVALRRCQEFSLPLVYFIGVRPGTFIVVAPAYIIAENSNLLEFTVGYTASEVGANLSSMSELERRYALRATKTRIHQRIFRDRVLHAYRNTCAICSLRHVELLDAAHIIRDSEPEGDPVVANGLTLCKIHHAAYDQNLMGITPHYVVEVNDALQKEMDGPMLKHGLQEMHGSKLHVPLQSVLRPSPERLAVRYDEFKSVG